MLIKNKETEKRIKNGVFSDFKSKKELGEWLIDSEYIKCMSDLDDWMKAHIPKEKFYQKRIMDFIRRKTENGELCASFVWKEQAGPYQRGGLPDVIAVVKTPNDTFGKVFFFEIKRPFFGKLSQLQKQTIEKIRNAGGIAEVVSYPWEVDAIFRKAGIYMKDQRMKPMWDPKDAPCENSFCYCPSGCGCDFNHHGKLNKYSHCPWYGQALDWSEDE